MLSDEEDNLIDYLEEQHGCHTVILYGSRAMDCATAESDWDILALNDGDAHTWCHRQVPGVGEVNAYIYPASQVAYNPANLSPLYRPPEYFIRLRFGRVLVEEAGFGTTIIQRAKDMYQRGPGPKPPHYDEHLHHQYHAYWLPKIADVRLSDMERQFYRARMLQSCLDHYFRHREMWGGMSARDGFNWLQANDPAAFTAFQKALRPEASLNDLTAWIDIMLNPHYIRS